MRLKIAGLLALHPIKTIKKTNLRNIKRFVTAIKNEPPTLVYHNVKNYIMRSNITGVSEPVYQNEKVRLLEEKYPGITSPNGIANAYALEAKFHPVPVNVSDNATQKVNILLPQLDPSIMFGGYISCLQFIAALVSANYRVRILICESFDFDKVAVLEKLQHNEVLHAALSQCEYENISAKSDVLTISKEDAFVAYSFWTGITAHQLAQTIDKKFIFFIQEFEPIFHPQDSFHAIGEYVYTLPHYAVFNTSILRDYFKQQKIGVFGGEKPDGDENSTFYQHALTKTAPPTIEDLQSRKKRRLLFYGRPEDHAKRNLFEIALIGLKTAVFNGVFDEGEWEFVGVGTLGTEHEIDLGHGHTLKLISKMSHDDYAASLRGFDVGLSLMYAPHPSLLPFEMASSGIVAVTNTYAQRDEKLLKGISENLVPCAPSIEGVAKGLAEAVNQCEDLKARIDNADIDWVNDWEDAFNDKVIAKLKKFIG